MLSGRLTHMLALAALLFAASPARAELTATHVAVALKSAKFLIPTLQPGDMAAIVYRDGDAASRDLAQSLADSMDASILRPRVVSTSDMDFTRTRLVFITDAALANIADIAAVADRHHAATVTSQAGCSSAGDCVLTVETEPRVQIYLSIDAAARAGISFSSAFLMLVKKH